MSNSMCKIDNVISMKTLCRIEKAASIRPLCMIASVHAIDAGFRNVKITAGSLKRKAPVQERPSKRQKLEMRDQHFQRTCQCSDAEQCRAIAIKLNTAILKGIPPLKVKISDKIIRNPLLWPLRNYKFNQAIVDSFQIRFKSNYPEIAYYIDPINIFDPVHDMETEIPQTFQGFIFRFIYKSPGGGVQAYADKIYGQSKRRPWESDYSYDRRTQYIITHVSTCVCSADSLCKSIDNFFYDYLINSNGHPPDTLKDNQTIIDQYQAAFANDYPGAAYFVDKISLVDPADDMQADQPQTFKGFLLKYRHWTRKAIMYYSNRTYGRGVRRPWESDFSFNKGYNLI